MTRVPAIENGCFLPPRVAVSLCFFTRWRYAVSVIRPALGGIRVRPDDVARVAQLRRRYVSVYSTAPSAAAAAAHKEIQAMDEELPFEAR